MSNGYSPIIKALSSDDLNYLVYHYKNPVAFHTKINQIVATNKNRTLKHVNTWDIANAIDNYKDNNPDKVWR